MTVLRTFRSCKPNGGPDHGFSVIEVLVSLAILALLLSLLPGALTLGESMWRMTGKMSQRQALTALVDTARQRLVAANPAMEWGSAQQSRLIFSGTSKQVTFLSDAAAGPRRGGNYLFSLAEQGASKPVRIVFTQAPYLPGTALPDMLNAPEARRTTVQVAALSFRYFGQKTDGVARTWHEDWNGTTTLPELVELTIAPWPSGSDKLTEIVALRLQSSGK